MAKQIPEDSIIIFDRGCNSAENVKILQAGSTLGPLYFQTTGIFLILQWTGILSLRLTGPYMAVTTE
ncbi:MAG: hypothetical protein QW292_11845 [Candidatus Parvarchaeota archaeon]